MGGNNGKQRKLTVKEQSFVNQYIIYLGNGVQAYLNSDYAIKDYNQAHVAAYKLLQKDYIQAAIAQKQKKALKKIDVSIERVLQELARLAFADINQFIDPKDGTVPNPVTLPADVRAAVADIQVITSYGKGGKKIVKHKIRAHDKSKALDMLMRYTGGYEQDNRQRQIDMEGMIKTLLDVVKSLPGPDQQRIMAGIEGKIGLIADKGD